MKLPPPDELERICKGLAALDAILCDDWELRYYSFNAAWNKGKKERMASMRNGEGDEWFIVFGKGVFVKAFWHEYPRAKNVYAGIPKALAHHLKEPSFTTEDVTWGGWHDGEWTLRGKPVDVKILAGDPRVYVTYAKEYFELKVPSAAVAHVLAGKPIDQKVLSALGSERTLADLKPELKEIGY